MFVERFAADAVGMGKRQLRPVAFERWSSFGKTAPWLSSHLPQKPQSTFVRLPSGSPRTSTWIDCIRGKELLVREEMLRMSLLEVSAPDFVA
ncbi:MAG: hypothetical protein ACR2JE_00510 [Acidobacteriaceae bacterium]